MGARLCLFYCLSMFQNRFYAVADDQSSPPAFRYGREDGSLITVGNTTAGAMKNLVSLKTFPFNDSISGRFEIWEIYGRTSPQGDPIYAKAPIGSTFIQLSVTSSAVSSQTLWVKTGTGASTWAQYQASVSAPTGVIVANGAYSLSTATVQTLSIAGVTVGDQVTIMAQTPGGGTWQFAQVTTPTQVYVGTVSGAAALTSSAQLNYVVVRAVTA
jgi:hypothetical protein